MLLVALNLVLGGGGGGEGGVRIGLGSVVVAWGGGEDEGPVLGLLVVPVVVVVVVGGEVDAGAALEGGEEGGSDAGPHPGRPALHGRRGDRSAARVTGVGSNQTHAERQAGEEGRGRNRGGREDSSVELLRLHQPQAVSGAESSGTHAGQPIKTARPARPIEQLFFFFLFSFTTSSVPNINSL